MQKLAILLVVCLMAVAPTFAGERVMFHNHHNGVTITDNGFVVDDIELDIDEGSIFLTHRQHRDDEVEITEDYKLFVNGELVETNAEQQKLVEEFYDGVFGIIDGGMRIGLEGAKIGLDGAKIGLKAVAGVFKMIFTSYDSDDLERDLERAAEKVEMKADVLEEKAEILEDMADNLEQVFDDLFYEVEELRDLDWL